MSSAGQPRTGEPAGLRLEQDAIGFREALAVGLASTAPAYSLAAVIGTVTVVVGFASERPLTGLMLGSVPHKLVHRSSVPVFIVPLPDG
ncbi:MAG: universal stress protein [Actinobacteria bacterium]|nr:universal stress protein [Actinomycetota bacterium]